MGWSLEVAAIAHEVVLRRRETLAIPAVHELSEGGSCATACIQTWALLARREIYLTKGTTQ